MLFRSMSASFISMLKQPGHRLSSGSSRCVYVKSLTIGDLLIGLNRQSQTRVSTVRHLLSRNVGEYQYVSHRMNGMPVMSRCLYRPRHGGIRVRPACLHLRSVTPVSHACGCALRGPRTGRCPSDLAGRLLCSGLVPERSVQRVKL